MKGEVKLDRKDTKNKGYTYVEEFKSNSIEMDYLSEHISVNYPDVLNDDSIWLRGLPFGNDREQIGQLFSGMKIVPKGMILTMHFWEWSTGEDLCSLFCGSR